MGALSQLLTFLINYIKWIVVVVGVALFVVIWFFAAAVGEVRLFFANSLPIQKDPDSGYQIVDMNKGYRIDSINLRKTVGENPFILSGGKYVVAKILGSKITETGDKNLVKLKFISSMNTAYMSDDCINKLESKNSLIVKKYDDLMKSHEMSNCNDNFFSCEFLVSQEVAKSVPHNGACENTIQNFKGADQFGKPCIMNETGERTVGCVDQKYIVQLGGKNGFQRLQELEKIKLKNMNNANQENILNGLAKEFNLIGKWSTDCNSYTANSVEITPNNGLLGSTVKYVTENGDMTTGMLVSAEFKGDGNMVATRVVINKLSEPATIETTYKYNQDRNVRKIWYQKILKETSPNNTSSGSNYLITANEGVSVRTKTTSPDTFFCNKN